MKNDAFIGEILLLGCGNMAGAMLDGWISAGVAPEKFTVVDPAAKEMPSGVALAENIGALERKYDTLLLGVKPQILEQVADDVRSATRPGALIISILAGVGAKHLQMLFPNRKIVRLMPNLSVALGMSPLGLWASDISDEERSTVQDRLAPLGSPEWMDSEELMDAFTALAGSGPAFVYRFIDALAAGGVATGLPEDQAQRIALQMTLGAARLAASSDDSPAKLARRVTSPGGTTAAGLDVLDENGSIGSLMKNTLRAARDRGAEMAKEAANRK